MMNATRLVITVLSLALVGQQAFAAPSLDRASLACKPLKFEETSSGANPTTGAHETHTTVGYSEPAADMRFLTSSYIDPTSQDGGSSAQRILTLTFYNAEEYTAALGQHAVITFGDDEVVMPKLKVIKKTRYDQSSPDREMWGDVTEYFTPQGVKVRQVSVEVRLLNIKFSYGYAFLGPDEKMNQSFSQLLTKVLNSSRSKFLKINIDSQPNDSQPNRDGQTFMDRICLGGNYLFFGEVWATDVTLTDTQTHEVITLDNSLKHYAKRYGIH